MSKCSLFNEDNIFTLKSEILKTKEQMRMFQKRGNGFGYKQAKAHLEKLYRKERSVRWN